MISSGSVSHTEYKYTVHRILDILVDLIFVTERKIFVLLCIFCSHSSLNRKPPG